MRCLHAAMHWSLDLATWLPTLKKSKDTPCPAESKYSAFAIDIAAADTRMTSEMIIKMFNSFAMLIFNVVHVILLSAVHSTSRNAAPVDESVKRVW